MLMKSSVSITFLNSDHFNDVVKLSDGEVQVNSFESFFIDFLTSGCTFQKEDCCGCKLMGSNQKYELSHHLFIYYAIIFYFL